VQVVPKSEGRVVNASLTYKEPKHRGRQASSTSVWKYCTKIREAERAKSANPTAIVAGILEKARAPYALETRRMD
jgi:hypothetical protein